MSYIPAIHDVFMSHGLHEVFCLLFQHTVCLSSAYSLSDFLILLLSTFVTALNYFTVLDIGTLEPKSYYSDIVLFPKSKKWIEFSEYFLQHFSENLNTWHCISLE